MTKQDPQAQLASIRAGLTEAARSFWGELIEALGDETPAMSLVADEAQARLPTERAMVALRGVDPSQQSTASDGTQIIVHVEGGQAWGIRLNPHAGALVRRARELQREFGFPPEARWSVTGRFVDIEAGFGEWAHGAEAGVNILKLRALMVEDQFVVLDAGPGKAPKVPGLKEAQAALEALHGEREAPVAREPRELLAPLTQALATNDWRLFRDLWVVGSSELDLEYSFRQFRRAYEVADGALAFERYDGDLGAGKVAPGAQVRMVVARADEAGATLTRPLLCRLEPTGWKFAGGIL